MTVAVLLALFVAPALACLGWRSWSEQPHWSDASHRSSGQSPPPGQVREAVVQVYGARTWGRRGALAMHTWIVCKRTNGERYRRFDVIGWRLRSGSAVVEDWQAPPDGYWFSNPPLLLADLRGDGVEAVIDSIEAAVADYPYRREYRTWPGPNSNTFTAIVARRVPELRLELPPIAIGKDYLAHNALLGPAPSGTGYQLSLFGVVGVLAGWREGVEVNLLGLVVGIRPWPLAIKLPGIGVWPAKSIANE